MEEKEFVLNFNVIELQKIVTALESLPYRDSNQLIRKIIETHEKQSVEAPKNE